MLKTCNIILKNKQTTIVHTKLDRWASYDLIKHMITTDVVSK